MTSFEELVAELGRVVGKLDELHASLARAGQFATEAVQELEAATRGAGQLEGDASQAVQTWTEVSTGTANLIRAVAVVQERVKGYRETLQGDQPAPLPTQASTWIGRQRAQLPTYVTSGFYRDEEGNSDLVQSGAEANGEDRQIAEHLVAIRRVRPRTFPTAAQHVETKVGWRMRVTGVQRAEVVVNNQLCEGPLSCFELLPLVLLPGQTLVVHDPVRSHTFHGRVAQ